MKDNLEAAATAIGLVVAGTTGLSEVYSKVKITKLNGN